MKKSICIVLVLFLLVIVFSMTNIQAEQNITIYDMEDDVIYTNASDLDQDEVVYTDERPNVDIVELRYSHPNNSNQVTVVIEVKGIIENRNDLDPETIDPESLNFSGSVVTYFIELETTYSAYQIEYVNESCTVNQENASFTVSGSELYITFDLETSYEDFVSMIGYTTEIEIISLLNMNLYMDIAPNNALFLASITATPSFAFIGEEISFSCEIEDFLNLSTAPYTYSWDFDDGTTGLGNNLSHAYLHPGEYNVSVIVQDSSGYFSATASTIVFIGSNIGEVVPIIYDEYPMDNTYDMTLPVSNLSANIIDFDGDPINVFIRWQDFQGTWNTLYSYNGINGNQDIIEEKDCTDIQYIMRYASNNTIIDTSYIDIQNRIGGNPLKVFVTLNDNLQPPIGYQVNYSSGIIEGLMTRLIGKEKGNTYTFTVPCEEAYGCIPLEVGDRFNSSTFAINSINPNLSLNQTLEVTELSKTNLSLKWVEITQFDVFTMPQIILDDLSSQIQEEMIIIPPPYYIWENSSIILSIQSDDVLVRTTPNKLTSITDTIHQINYGLGENDIYLIFPDATIASYDATKITLDSNPTVGDEYYYELDYFGQIINITYTIEEVTSQKINVSLTYDESNQAQYITVNRTYSFNREYEMPRTYDDIPMLYAESLLGSDIQREGYSLHELAGEDMLFEITIEKVLKTSQYHTYYYNPSGPDWNMGGTSYTWSVNVTDGNHWTNETYHFFTTGASQLYNLTGTVTYQGGNTGTFYVYVYNQYPVEGTHPYKTMSMSSPGDFTFMVPNGTYYVWAFLDIDGNHLPEMFSEPIGYAINKTVYQYQDMILVDGSDVENVDVLIKDWVDITGDIDYYGNKTGEIYIVAFDEYPDQNSTPIYYTTISSPGSYTLKVHNGTFYIGSFMDVDGDNYGDITEEPIGFAYNRNVFEGDIPDQITVDLSPVNNVDLILYDPPLPEISNINIHPILQQGSGYVNISCEATSYFGINEVILQITDPDGISENMSITQNHSGSVYWINKTYTIDGTYSFNIYVNDSADHAMISDFYQFWLVKNIIYQKTTGGYEEIDLSGIDTKIIINTTQSTNMIIIEYGGEPHPEESLISSVGTYLDIDIENWDDVIDPVNITMYYTQSDLDDAGIIEDDIFGLYFWNDTINDWELFNQTGVNTSYNDSGYEGYVWARIWHLTPIGIGGDNQPPSKVSGLSVQDVKDGKLKLTWDAAMDNVLVDHYEIWRDNSFLTTTTSTQYQDMGLTNNQQYTYKARAVDSSGNIGDFSDEKTGKPTKSSTSGGSSGGGGGAPPAGPTNTNPIADVSEGEPYQGTVGEAIIFDGSASLDSDGDDLTYEWDFGDGAMGTGETITHIYSAPGTYTVILTVEDSIGAEDTDETQAVIVKLNNPPSKPSIEGLDTGTIETEYNYTLKSVDIDNDTIQYTIIWGDESQDTISEFLPNATGFITIHSWSNAGKYSITVTASDNETESESSTFTVYIDSIEVGTLGYILDSDGDETYDLFHNESSNIENNIGHKNGIYLIDDDNDGTWDYTYSLDEGIDEYVEQKEDTPGFEITIMMLSMIIIIILWKRKR